jgi:ABC-type multidrug transport system fused ATPase/permease subunit
MYCNFRFSQVEIKKYFQFIFSRYFYPHPIAAFLYYWALLYTFASSIKTKSVFSPRKKKNAVKLKKGAWKKALRIFTYFRPYATKFTIGMLILVVSSGMSMLFPALVGKLIDAVNGQTVDFMGYSFVGINSLASALILLFSVQAVLAFLRIYLFNDVTERVLMAIRKDTYQHLLALPMSYFSTKRVGELNSRISSDIAQVQETFTIVIAELIRQSLTLIIGITALTLYSYKLTLIMLGSLPVVIIVAVLIGKKVKAFSKETQKAVSESNVIVEETLTAIHSVKAFANEFFEINRYGNKVNEVRAVAMRGVFARGFMSSFIIFAIFGAFILVIWQAAKLMEAGEMSNGDLTTFLFYTIFVGASIGGAADLYSRLQKGVGSTEDLLDIFSETPENISLHDSPQKMENFKGEIEFDNVTFHYPSRPEIEVLKNISFSVRKGERIALVGQSGAGKSTMVSLILRFFDPVSGEVKMDGKPSDSYPLSDLRNEMAIVPQEVILFGGSILENIAYGKPDATREEIENAARKANALEFIESFPEGFETVVGERGIQLSGGQRQRIAIARAVLKNPKILILDEATSSLDSESERLVQEALDELMKNRTSIVIAHRLSTVRKADQIFVMKNGEIIERGTHEELVQLDNGMYKNLSELQLDIR